MAWDIANATYTSTKDVSGRGIVTGVTFSGDGTKMFVMGFGNQSVYRYDLSTAWDLTSATYVSLKSVSAQDTQPYEVTFSPDGTKMFVVGDTNNSVYRYDLMTAWDVTTASYVSTKSVLAQGGFPLGVTFTPDGTKMFVLDYINDSVYRYNLSTAWDITSATYVSAKSVSAQDTEPLGVTFSGDGTKMFVVGRIGKNVYRYDLSTAWDITTATYVSLKDVLAQDTHPFGVAFSGDGAIMFVVGNTNKSVYRYDLTAPVTGTPAAASSVSDAEVTAGSVTFAGVLASVASSTLAAVVAATLVISGTTADATSATDAAAATGTLALTGTSEVVAQSPIAASTGTVTASNNGVANLLASAPVLEASGVVTPPTFTGTVGLVVQSPTVTALGTTSVPNFTGIATLTAQNATLESTGNITYPVNVGSWAIWNGSTEIPVGLTVWNGTTEDPVILITQTT